jgi:hypothetical protein
MRRQKHRQEWLPGMILGLVVGVPLTILSLAGNQTFSADRTTSAVWLIGLFLLWGYAIHWTYNRLTYALTSAAPDKTPNVSVEQIDRRQFLIRLGGATAAITVVGALVGSMSGEDGGIRTVSLGTSATEAPDANLPNANAAVQPAPGTRPELTPVAEHYRIDISLQPPEIELASWTLPFVVKNGGSETTIASLTMDEIRALPDQHGALERHEYAGSAEAGGTDGEYDTSADHGSRWLLRDGFARSDRGRPVDHAGV